MTTRYRQSRRTVLQTLGSLGAVSLAASGIGGARDGAATGSDCDTPQPLSSLDSPQPPSSPQRATPQRDADAAIGDLPAEGTRYVAVVDRIVDGEHVVLLLEDDGELVDQLVVPAAEYADLEEGDILLAVVADDTLRAYRVVPERPAAESAW